MRAAECALHGGEAMVKKDLTFDDIRRSSWGLLESPWEKVSPPNLRS